MSAWIPVDRELPGIGSEVVDVVVRYRNGHRVRVPNAILTSGGIWRHFCGWQPIAAVATELATVTHWMPVSPLP